MDGTDTSVRRRRFRRKEAEWKEPTARELALLGHIARHRFLSNADLAVLDGGSAQNVTRIMGSLYDRGLVERPKAQVSTWAAEGVQSLIYGLSNRGARLLHGRRDNEDHSENNRRAGVFFVHHTAETGSFFARLEVACDRDPDIELLTQQDIIADAPEATRKMRESLRIKTTPASGQENERLITSVIPDGAFGLAFADDTASYFFVELDRGTMPVTRKGNSRTSMKRKFAIYLDAWRGGVFERQFGIPHARILTITTSKERIKTMIEAVKLLTDGKGSGLFLFIDRKSLESASPLSVEWLSGKGERVSLLG